MLTFGSLFAGIGGLDLGLERAGMKCLWQVEIDEFCQRVLAKHWPGVERFGDVRECGKYNLAPVDLVCGGFPCQPVSCAGKRKGESDERWLWPEFARVVCELRPRWVLAENVPGLLSVDAGRVFGGILRDLAAIGYDAEWDCVSAAAVGAPHIRDRVFVLAYANVNRHAAGEQEHTPPREPVRLGEIGDVADAASDLRGASGHERPQPFNRGGSDVADASVVRCARCTERESCGTTKEGRVSESRARNWWAVEPDVGRVAHGVPARVDRLKSLGNAVVPQVAEFVGRMIVDADCPPA